jgi:hypothetical protein
MSFAASRITAPKSLLLLGAALMVSSAMAAELAAADEPPVAFLTPDTAGPDFAIQGEYLGKIGEKTPLGAHVIALGGGKFDVVLYAKGLPGAGWDGKTKVRLTGETVAGKTTFAGQNFQGEIYDGILKGVGDDNAPYELQRQERASPTLGMAAPSGALVLFDGKNVDEWDGGKIAADGFLDVGTRTKRKFSSYTLHLEFRTPFMPTKRGQGRGNSGLYLNDQYECQVLDSFGLTGENNECGGFYQIAKPLVNMCLPPLSWQTYDIEFDAAKFDADGKKTAPAVVTVKHNGVVIHDKFELPRNTPGGGVGDEKLPGGIYLQNHNDPVRFRNIWIAEKK